MEPITATGAAEMSTDCLSVVEASGETPVETPEFRRRKATVFEAAFSADRPPLTSTRSRWLPREDRREVRLLIAVAIGVWLPFAARSHGDELNAVIVPVAIYLVGVISSATLARKGAGMATAAGLSTIAGAALAMQVPIGWAFALLFLAAGDAGMELDTRQLAVVLSGGVGACVVAGVVHGRHAGAVIGCSAAIVGFALLGAERCGMLARAAAGEWRAREAERVQDEKALATALAERARIARDLHDVLAHSLSAIAVQVETARALLDHGADRELLSGPLLGIRRTVRSGLAETRHALAALHGTSPALGSFLRNLVEDPVNGLIDFDVDVDVDAAVSALPPETATAVYRISQEALSNARRHGTGGHTRFAVTTHEQRVELIVSNPASQLGSPSGDGYGLRGMRARAQEVGGTLQAGYHPDLSEWIIRVVLPITVPGRLDLDAPTR